MRLKEAQEKLQEIPRLRQQVRDYKSSKRKLQEDLRQLKEKHKHLEEEIANITDARENARKDLEASRKKVQKERERAWYFKSILLTTIPILFIFVLSLLLMSIRENLRGLGFDWKDWWLIPSVLVLPTLGVIWWQIRHFSVSKTSGRSVSNLPRKPRKR
jgi:ATP-dependent Zn protease